MRILVICVINSIKGVDTGNAARCNTHIMCPKHGFGGIRCLSLYEQVLGWMRSHSKEEGSVHSALVMVGRIVLISNNTSVQSRAKVDKIHPHESKYF